MGILRKIKQKGDEILSHLEKFRGKGDLVQNILTEELGSGSGEWGYVKGGFTETNSEIL